VAATYIFLYRQVFYKRNLEEVYSTVHDFLRSPLFKQGMAVLLLLMIVNWGLETIKWRVLIGRIEKVGFLRAFMAVMTGVSVSIFLPNRSGEYLGRVFILEKANRMEGVLITIIGSISQMIITIAMGLFGFLAFYYQYLNKHSVLHDYMGAALILLVPITVFTLLLLYINMPGLTPLLSRIFRGRWKKYAHYVEVFSKFNAKILFKILIISLVRYVVFSMQFYIFLRLFNVEIPIPDALVLITVIYLFMMVLPSIALTEIGIRGSVSVFMFNMYFLRMGIAAEPYQLGVFAASSLLWFINIVLPALAGTFFVFNLKFFRK
jgi:hypothetical protein